MDFGHLPKSAMELVASLAVAANVSFAPAIPPTTDVNLKYPALISSYNLPPQITTAAETPAPLQSLGSVSDNGISLKLVVNPDIKDKVATVELPPPVYTVKEPTPTPSSTPKADDKEDSKISLIKEAKADEASPSPSASPSTTPSPSPSSSPVPAGNSNSEKLFSMVNDYRAKQNLKAFEKDERLCKMAADRAPQVDGELANGELHKGFKALNLPYWATENIAAYSSIEQDFNFWISDYIHKKAIESDNKYSCVACSGSSCSEIFTSFVSK